VTMTTSFIS